MSKTTTSKISVQTHIILKYLICIKTQYYNLEPVGKSDQLSNYGGFLCPGKGTEIFNKVLNQHRTQNTQTKTKSRQETEIWGEKHCSRGKNLRKQSMTSTV